MNTSESPGRKVKLQKTLRGKMTASIAGGAVAAAAIGMLTLGHMNTAETSSIYTPAILVEDTFAPQRNVVQDIVASTFGQSRDGSGQLAMLNDVVSTHPNDSLAYHTRGLFFAAEGKDKKALADFSEAIRLNPGFAEAYLNRAHIYVSMGELGRACADYNEALMLNPQLSEVYQYRGYVYYQLGQFSNAIADYSAAIAHQPTAANFVMRGEAYAQLDQLDLAYNDFWASMRLESSTAQTEYSQATNYYSVGDYQNAAQGYTDAIRVDPNYPAAYNGRAYSYFNMGYLDAALRDINIALELAPDNPAYYDSRCEFYLKSGEWTLGLADCEKADSIGWVFSDFMTALIDEAHGHLIIR